MPTDRLARTVARTVSPTCPARRRASATLVVLLVTIVTVHAAAVTGTVGPVHGGLYVLCSLAVVAMRWVRGWSWVAVALELLRRDRAGATRGVRAAGWAPGLRPPRWTSREHRP